MNQGTSSRAGAALINANLGFARRTKPKFEGPIPGSPEKSQVSGEPGSGTPALIKIVFPGCPEENVIDGEGPGIPGCRMERQRAPPLCPHGLQCQSILSCSHARGGAQEQQLLECKDKSSSKSRSLLCDAHCWAPRDIACALRMCWASVYYGISSHSLSMCTLAH
jgi:hypothetical protein